MTFPEFAVKAAQDPTIQESLATAASNGPGAMQAYLQDNGVEGVTDEQLTLLCETFVKLKEHPEAITRTGY